MTVSNSGPAEKPLTAEKVVFLVTRALAARGLPGTAYSAAAVPADPGRIAIVLAPGDALSLVSLFRADVAVLAADLAAATGALTPADAAKEALTEAYELHVMAEPAGQGPEERPDPRRLTVSETEARILGYLHRNGEGTLPQISLATGLTRRAVQTALQRMRTPKRLLARVAPDGPDTKHIYLYRLSSIGQRLHTLLVLIEQSNSPPTEPPSP